MARDRFEELRKQSPKHQEAYSHYAKVQKGEIERKIKLNDIIWYHRESVNGRLVFRDYDDEHIAELAASLHEHGQLSMITVFPSKIEEGKYEVLEGKQRTRAARLNRDKYADAPDEIRAEVLDPEKVSANDYQLGDLIFVNTNVYRREQFLPSEWGMAFEMQARAMSHQGSRYSEIKETNTEIAKKSNTSISKIRYYRRIIPDHCIEEFIDAVDRDKLPLSGVALYLTYFGTGETSRRNQQTLYNFIEEYCDRDQNKIDAFLEGRLTVGKMKELRRRIGLHKDSLLTGEDLQILLPHSVIREVMFRAPSAKILQEIIPQKFWNDPKQSAEYLVNATQALDELRRYKEKYGEL